MVKNQYLLFKSEYNGMQLFDFFMFVNRIVELSFFAPRTVFLKVVF